MTRFQIEQLRQFPQRPGEVWQGAVVRMPTWIKGEDDRPFRPWAALWAAVESGTLPPVEMGSPSEIDAATLAEGLIGFATDTEIGGYRPGRIEVRDAEVAEAVRPLAEPAGIEVVERETLAAIDFVLNHMAEYMAGRTPPPGCFTGEEVTTDQMRRFAEAAEAFYNAEPWRHLGGYDVLTVESPVAPPGMAYLTVMGAARNQYGLSFHADADERWAIERASSVEASFSSRKEGSWSLMFGPINELPFEDADVWEQAKLPVADQQAYPLLLAFHVEHGVTRPDAERLAFVSGILRALARTTEQQIDTGRWTVTVDTGRGAIDLTLALPDLLEPPDRRELMRRGIEPDRRSMEQMHAQINRFMEDKSFQNVEELNAAIQKEFVGKTPDADHYPPRTALEKAQELCYEAFDAIGRRRVQLAREALAISEDCADGYNLLAEQCGDPVEAGRLYEQAVASGERALGPERFEEDAGHFWGQTDTRPYMRARLGLAHSLEAQSKPEQAIGHYREMLRLNPDDNQGVRYFYLARLLELGHDHEAAQFMQQADDEPTAFWTYTKALLAFRLGGDTPTTRRERGEAIKANAHVPEILASDEPPDLWPSSYSLGSMEEAVICAAELGAAYDATPGATTWIVAGRKRQRRPSQRQKTRRQRKRKSR